MWGKFWYFVQSKYLVYVCNCEMKDKFSNEFELKVSAKDYDYSALKLQKYCQDNLPKLGKNEETSCSIYVQSSTNYSLEFPHNLKTQILSFQVPEPVASKLPCRQWHYLLHCQSCLKATQIFAQIREIWKFCTLAAKYQSNKLVLPIFLSKMAPLFVGKMITSNY